MALETKYFVLKPRSKSANDPHAEASRRAMIAYAHAIRNHDPELAESLRDWTAREDRRQDAAVYEETRLSRVPTLHPGDTVDIMATSSTFKPQKDAVGHTGLVIRSIRHSGYPGFAVVVQDGKSAGYEIWFHANHLKLLAATKGTNRDNL